MPPEPAQPLSVEAPTHQRPKTSFWELHPTKGNSPWQQTTAPTRLRSGKQRTPFSPRALRSPYGDAGLGCPWLPGPCCFAGGLQHPKPTPYGFSFVGKQDWVREGLLRPVPSHAPQPARPLSAEVPTQWRPKTSFWELHPAKGNSPWQQTTAPIRLGLGKQRTSFSPPALLSP